MIDERRQFEALRPLLIGLTDDQLDGEQREQLADLLRNDPAARTYYLQYMLTDAMLHLEHGGREEWEERRGERVASEANPKPQINKSQISNLPPPVSIILDDSSAPTPLSSLPSPLYVTHPFLFSNLFALAVLCLGIFGAWMYQIDIPGPIARSDRSPAFAHTASTAVTAEYIGQITGISNTTTWQDESTSTVSGARVPLGRRYALASGLLEITYDSGAKVVLQGPATYEVETRDGGFLSRGKLTARLAKGSEGLGTGGGKGAGGQWPVASERCAKSRNPEISKSPISNPQSLIPNPLLPPALCLQSPAPVFTVRTPSATVTDLGTEFGVYVQDEATCNVHVFEGKVQVAVPSVNGTRGFVRQLTAGQITQVSGGKVQSITASGLHPMKVVYQQLHPNGFHVGMNDGFDNIMLRDAALCVERSLGASQRLRLSWNDFGHIGSAWHSQKQSVAQGFSTGFQFQFAYPQGVGGDGLAFIVQNTAQAEKLRVGVAGSKTNALNVSIHSYQNAGDPSNAFLAIRDGSKTLAICDLHQRIGLASLTDGRIHTLQVDYSPGSLDVHFDYVQVIKNLKVDLTKLENGGAIDSEGKAWLGFSASTGEMAKFASKNHTENHDILSWTFLPIRLSAAPNTNTKP